MNPLAITIPDSLSRRELRKREVRSRITEASMTLFSRQGFEQTTVEEICELAEVARKTFYNYYASKQELVRELSQSMLYDETSNLVEMSMEKFPDTRRRLEYIFDYMFENLRRYQDLDRLLIHQALMDMSNENSGIGQQLSVLNQSFARLIQAGQERGDVLDQFESDFLGEMVLSSINNVVLNWIHDSDYPLIERLQRVGEFLAQSLLCDSAR